MRRTSSRLLLFGLLAATGMVPLLALIPLRLATAAILWIVPVFLVGAYLVAVVATQPLEELFDAAQRIREGDLKARTVIRPGSIWWPLAAVIFELAERLDRVTRNLEAQVEERTSALARKADQLRAVGQVGQQVAAVLEPDSLLHFVVRVMRGTFGYDVAAVVQRHGDHLVLTGCAARGHEDIPLGRVFPLSGASAPPLAVGLEGDGGISRAVTPLVNAMTAESELAVPMRIGDRTLGVLVIQSLRPQAFDEEDAFTVRTIAGQVAVALENARLFEAERQLRDLAVSEERNRMAREIHDTLAQAFMGVVMQLRAMQGATDEQTARFHREEAEALAREGLQEARRSVWNLRPSTLEGKGLAGALAAEVEVLERRAALRTVFETEGAVDRLPPPVEAALLRIAQEAMHNTVKYARASHLAVRLIISRNAAELTIADDGVGFDPALVQQSHENPSNGGFGLRAMAERARLIGGRIQVDASPGQGCRITAFVPLNT